MDTAEKNADDKNESANESDKQNKGLLQSISVNALLLGAFALVCTGFIVGTFFVTGDKIAEQERMAKLRALYQIIPKAKHDNDLLVDNIALLDESLGHRQEQRLYLAKLNNKPVTLIYPATARDGYSGDIKFIVGVNLNNNSVAGVRVLSHRETPGLGDAIEIRKSDWITYFNGKRLGEPPAEQWTVRKDGGAFDGFTGATITPRALTTAIASVLAYHEKYGGELRKQLVAAASNTSEQSND